MDAAVTGLSGASQRAQVDLQSFSDVLSYNSYRGTQYWRRAIIQMVCSVWLPVASDHDSLVR